MNITKQRGNILFLILLAVVLFAALSYAVTQSMRGGGGNAGDENVKLEAARFLQYLSSIDTAILRMHLVEGIPYENISFRYDAVRQNGDAITNYQNNANCTTNDCRVFESEGGGIAPPIFPELGIEPDGDSLDLAPGYMVTSVFDWPGAGTNANDIALVFLRIRENICREINEQLGIESTPSVAGPLLQAQIPDNWDNAGHSISSNANQLFGKSTGAMVFGGGACRIYHVVIAR